MRSRVRKEINPQSTCVFRTGVPTETKVNEISHSLDILNAFWTNAIIKASKQNDNKKINARTQHFKIHSKLVYERKYVDTSAKFYSYKT